MFCVLPPLYLRGKGEWCFKAVRPSKKLSCYFRRKEHISKSLLGFSKISRLYEPDTTQVKMFMTCTMIRTMKLKPLRNLDVRTLDMLDSQESPR